MTNTIKNGRYGDAEHERLSAYAHPNYSQAVSPKNAPKLERPKRSYTRGELGDLISNEEAGSWRGVKDDPDY